MREVKRMRCSSAFPPAELMENEATRKALGLVEKSAMTEGQLYAYERFWLSVVDERILREAAVKKGYNEG